jgi:hypothetical protein
MQSEKAPEVVALVQPKSIDNGFRKIPKVNNEPHIISVIRNEAAAMI